MSRDDAPASVEERLLRVLHPTTEIVAPGDASPADADPITCLEASRLRSQHDAITPPIARALLRTGVWKADDLQRFLAGYRTPGAAALVASACCEMLEANQLPAVLELIEAETDLVLAAHATGHLVSHCLRTNRFDTAERAVTALANRERELGPRVTTEWLTTALAVHEQLHGHGDPSHRMRSLADGQARELFEEWLTGNQEPWRRARPLESEEAGRREALLTVLEDSSPPRSGARGSLIARLGERRARARALDAVLDHARTTSDPGMLLRAAASMASGRRRRALVREAITMRELDARSRFGRDAGETANEESTLAELFPLPGTPEDPVLAWLTEAGVHPAPAADAGQAMWFLAAEHDEIGAHLLRLLGELSAPDDLRARILCRIAPFLHASRQQDAAICLAAELERVDSWAAGFVTRGAEGIGGANGVASALAPRLSRSALLRAIDACCLASTLTRASWCDLRGTLEAMEDTEDLPGAVAGPLTRLAGRAPEALDFPALLLRLAPGDCLQAAAQLPPERRSVLLARAAGDPSFDAWTQQERYELLHRGRQCGHARTLLELRMRPPRSENALFAILDGLNQRLTPTRTIAGVLGPFVETMTDRARLQLLARIRRLPLWLRLELLPTLLERTLTAEEGGTVSDGATHQLRESLADLSGTAPVELGPRTRTCIAALGGDLLSLSHSQLLNLVARLASTTDARDLRPLLDTLLNAASADAAALDLVAVAAQLPDFGGDARAAPLLERWLATQAPDNPVAGDLPQAAWDCLDLEALERLEKDICLRSSDPSMPLARRVLASSCRRCWIERSPHAALDRVERALEEAPGPRARTAELGALDALADCVDAAHLSRYLELYRRVHEAGDGSAATAGFAGIMRRGLALGRGMEEVLSWMAFAPTARQIEPLAALASELGARETVVLWRWLLGRRPDELAASSADHPRRPASEFRLLAGTLDRIGPQDAAALWREVVRRAPELDEEACLALACAFLPELVRMHGASALTALVHHVEQRVADAARAAAAAGVRQR